MAPAGSAKPGSPFRAAADQLAHYEDGVYFVSLVSVDLPSRLASAIAVALKISLYGSDDPHQQVINYLHDKHMLLVLDNFESLLESVDSVERLVDVLAHAPQLKCLITSRERLNVQEEWVLPIEGMPYPNLTPPAPEDIEQFSAVRLFVQRAHQVQPAFALARHLPAVISICQQVEGMPLALELAASWLRVMPADQIAARLVAQLASSLDFLTTPLRNVPERHSSLRAVFDGSWILLSEVERTVLMGLSIFRGGFDLAAAESVVEASLPILASLIDKSLMRVSAAGRYDLHELLRQYSAEKLAASGEAASTARRHLTHFLSLAERAEAEIYGPQQSPWFDRLEDEYGNLHAALAWSLRNLDSGEGERGLCLAAALGWFWQLRMYLREGSQWFERLLNADSRVINAPVSGSASVRAKALHRASEIETQLNQSARAQALAEESLAVARTVGDTWNTAWALAAIGLWGKHGLMQIAPLEEALTLFRGLHDGAGDGWGISHTLRRLSLFLERAGDFGRAADLAEEALALARAAQDKSAMAWSLYALGLAKWRMPWRPDNNRGRAVILFEESLPLFRDIRDVSGLAIALDLLGALVLMQGENVQARLHFEENLRLMLERKWTPPLTHANSLVGVLALAWQRAEYAKAARLLAAFEDRLDMAQVDSATFLLGARLAEIRSQCRDRQFAAAWAEGRVITLEQAVALALRSAAPAIVHHQPDARQTLGEPLIKPLIEPLSKRELEVVKLLAQGLSNAQIAQKLYLSAGTVKVHTRNIYGKLGVNSRTQAIAQARQLNLIVP